MRSSPRARPDARSRNAAALSLLALLALGSGCHRPPHGKVVYIGEDEYKRTHEEREGKGWELWYVPEGASHTAYPSAVVLYDRTRARFDAGGMSRWAVEQHDRAARRLHYKTFDENNLHRACAAIEDRNGQTLVVHHVSGQTKERAWLLELRRNTAHHTDLVAGAEGCADSGRLWSELTELGQDLFAAK